MADQHLDAGAAASPDSTVTLLTASEFKDAASVEGADLSRVGMWKTAPDSQKAVNADGSIDFCISNEGQDRDGDTISLEGWQTDNFAKNPVVLFAHQHDELPVGKSVSLRREAGELISRVEFTPRDMNPLGDTLRRMYAEGFMNAQSVGFQPETWQQRSESDEGANGWHFTRQDLLEHSCVPVPSLPTALMRAHEAKINTTPLREWCEKMLDGDIRTGLARDDLERAWAVRTASPMTLVEFRSINPNLNGSEIATPDVTELDGVNVSEAPVEEIGTVKVRVVPEIDEPAFDSLAERIASAIHAKTRIPVSPAAEQRLRSAIAGVKDAMEGLEAALGDTDADDATVEDYEDAYGSDFELEDLSEDDLHSVLTEVLDEGAGDATPQNATP